MNIKNDDLQFIRDYLGLDVTAKKEVADFIIELSQKEKDNRKPEE